MCIVHYSENNMRDGAINSSVISIDKWNKKSKLTAVFGYASSQRNSQLSSSLMNSSSTAPLVTCEKTKNSDVEIKNIDFMLLYFYYRLDYQNELGLICQQTCRLDTKIYSQSLIEVSSIQAIAKNKVRDYAKAACTKKNKREYVWSLQLNVFEIFTGWCHWFFHRLQI